MTKHQALAKAKELWGDTAMIETRISGGSKYNNVPKGKRMYSVGTNVANFLFSVMGSGASWEEAFADYKRK